MNHQPGFFDFAAEVGLTKHIGGLEATETLIEQCHIGKDSYIRDVGCGVGARIGSMLIQGLDGQITISVASQFAPKRLERV